jgi:hypothetical protein
MIKGMVKKFRELRLSCLNLRLRISHWLLSQQANRAMKDEILIRLLSLATPVKVKFCALLSLLTPPLVCPPSV